MLALLAAGWMAIAPMSDDEVLATVNGTPITRRELQNALTDRARQEYRDALEDLGDLERSAVRDYMGRQCVEREAQQEKTTAATIYARELEKDFDRFDPNLRNRVNQQRERIYEAERASLDELIQKRLIEQAARERGVTVEQFNRAIESEVQPVTQSDMDFIVAYENAKQQAAQAPVGPERLAAAIRAARVEEKKSEIVDAMRRGGAVQSRLAPPRVSLSITDAPVIGSPSAPVRVVVFTDFECPYCNEAEQMLRRLERQYGERMAIFYRNYPLPNHLYARPAAIAAVCAAEQGRYLQLHDLLFAHQNELAHADYEGWAQMAGLDRTAFDRCRTSAEAAARVDRDIREGVAAGVAGTPTFFVNGRMVRDAQSLPAVVAEENAVSR